MCREIEKIFESAIKLQVIPGGNHRLDPELLVLFLEIQALFFGRGFQENQDITFFFSITLSTAAILPARVF